MSNLSGESLSPHALIIGCGYLGRALARTLSDNGVVVFGTVRHERTAAGVRAHRAMPLICDVTNPVSLAALNPAIERGALDVYYLVPPGAKQGATHARRTVIDGAEAVLARLADADVRRIVVASSTGVYGQVDGESVDAQTPPQPQTDRAKLLVEGEQVWLNHDLGQTNQCRVVRLAGLYGPHRVVGLSAVQQNSVLVGQADAWLNLIHVDDAVDLLITLMQSEAALPTELGSDGSPVRRLEYYNDLAKRIGAPPVRMIEDEAELRAMGLEAARIRSTGLGKRCDPTPTMQRTGWSPLYPSFCEGFATLPEVVLRAGL